MMMKWHKASEELPKERTTVLLAYYDANMCYSEKTTIVCHRIGNKWIYCGSHYNIGDIDDRWAYIELPED